MRKRGFTIVELLIVIVVIGILAAISIITYTGVQNQAKAAATQVDLSNFEKKFQLYAMEQGTLPDSIAAMQADGFGQQRSWRAWIIGTILSHTV